MTSIHRPGAPPKTHCHSALQLGMPHLGLAGISEGWLFRYLGHVHWTLIENAVAQASTSWADTRGSRLYASFVAVEVQGPLLACAREGDTVCCEGELERIGTGLYLSLHRLTLASRPMLSATAQLCTTFVRRSRAGDNHDFEKATDGPTVLRGPVPTRRKLALLDSYRLHRSRASNRGTGAMVFPVVPPEDFNGAGMVYFANYIRYVDRAEWHTSRGQGPLPLPVYRRRVYYYGNLNAGDSVQVELLGRANGLSRTRLSRAGRGDAVAYCETERR